MAATWRSSWPAAPGSSDQQVADAEEPAVVQVQTLPDGSGGVATLSALPLRLERTASSQELPTEQDTSPSVPCELSLQWGPQPLRCKQLKLEIVCSARHVELYIVGSRRNLLGEEEDGEVYLGTFRGSRQGAMPTGSARTEPQFFTMSPAFSQSNRDFDVLKSVQTLRVKFVSLTGDKSALILRDLRCIYVSMAPVARSSSSTGDLASQLSGLKLGDKAGGSALAVADVQSIIQGLQQTLEREMETKIARAIDAKLSTLSQRLAFSEQALFQLHQKLDAKDSRVQQSLGEIQHKFSQLEAQLSQLSAPAGGDDATTDAVVEAKEAKARVDEPEQAAADGD
ncbi:hypothetical protein BBJ28_00009848 [Nothophytophthora sp. Chile5]|nr:hypothetical protein BBJ28_00009848 [Nothophytophthora sp. Chile5]